MAKEDGELFGAPTICTVQARRPSGTCQAARRALRKHALAEEWPLRQKNR